MLECVEGAGLRGCGSMTVDSIFGSAMESSVASLQSREKGRGEDDTGASSATSGREGRVSRV